MKKFLGIVVVLMAILVVMWLRPTRLDLYLVANDFVPVYASEEAAMKQSSQTMTQLHTNERVPVVTCVDMKHYQIYKVRLVTGAVGFVNAGKYSLVRDGREKSTAAC